jgi:hypothetical protein
VERSDRRKRAERRGRVLHGIRRSIGLEALVREHLIKKAKAGRVTSETLEEAELYLTRAAGYFGRERDLASVTVGEVQRWVEHLRPLPSKQGTPGLSGGTLRHHLNHLSNLSQRAQSEESLDGGAPVSVYTVARELGHGGESLVRRIYGHLGDVRHRSEVVEYRVEQHEERLRDRLAVLTN